jgi:Lrp/AsnC family transcriptional regulator, leucine-responsive regulatory protein
MAVSSEHIPLDEVDQRLLTLLQDDASRSNQALADAAHVSPATALRRVRRLVDAGVIERQVAIVSPQAFDSGLTAIVEITLDRQGVEHLDAFEARALAEASVQQCYRVAPGPDIVLVVWVRDMGHYNALVQRLFTEDANVRNVKSYFATRRAKFEPRVDLTPRPPQPLAPTRS